MKKLLLAWEIRSAVGGVTEQLIEEVLRGTVVAQ